MAALTARTMLRTMRAGGMPVDAVARILKVERKDIYACIDKGRIPTAARSRLLTIFTIANEELAGEFRSMYRVWRRPMTADGRSLLDLLTADVLDEGAIRSACRDKDLKRSVERYAAMDRNPVVIRMEGYGNPVLDDLPIADLGPQS